MANRKSAFTLIELLVVIAIIAILAAILFPVFAQAREKARQTACASNLKQLGLAFMQYIQDYDECPPNGHGYSTSVYNTVCTNHELEGWAGQLYPYVKSTGVFTCPDDLSNSGSPAGSTVLSYAYNMDLDNQTSTTIPAGSGGGCYNTTYPTAKWVAPTMTVLLAEARLIYDPPTYRGTGVTITNGPETPNNSTCSDAACVDSYVSPATNGYSNFECDTKNSCNDPQVIPGYTGPNTGLNNYAGLNTGPFIGTPITGSSCFVGDVIGRHSGGSNFLFCDGHVKYLLGTKVTGGTSAANSEATQSGGTAAGTGGLSITGSAPTATFSII